MILSLISINILNYFSINNDYIYNTYFHLDYFIFSWMFFFFTIQNLIKEVFIFNSPSHQKENQSKYI